MSLAKLTTSLLFLTLVLYSFHTAFGSYPLIHVWSSSSNFTSGSAYKTNLGKLMSYLSYKTPPTGFSIFATGQIFEEAYGLALSRGDLARTGAALTKLARPFGMIIACWDTMTLISLAKWTTFITCFSSQVWQVLGHPHCLLMRRLGSCSVNCHKVLL